MLDHFCIMHVKFDNVSPAADSYNWPCIVEQCSMYRIDPETKIHCHIGSYVHVLA